VLDGYREIAAEEYLAFTKDWMEQAFRVLRPPVHSTSSPAGTASRDVLQALDETGFTTINHLIWKYQFGFSRGSGTLTSHYHILFAAKDPKEYFFSKASTIPRMCG